MSDEFLFLGGHPAFDFVNTWTVDRGKRVERLGDFDALVRWARAAKLAGGTLEPWLAGWTGHADAAAIHAEALRVREELRRWLREEKDLERLVAVVNEHLERARPEVRLVAGGMMATRVTRYGDAGPVMLLGALARAVESLLCDVVPDAQRRCAASDCEAYFIAEGRTIWRRWCSDRRCGTRARNQTYEKAGNRPYNYNRHLR
jgi:predicted RNA-binding Zn ribbon-like protein